MRLLHYHYAMEERRDLTLSDPGRCDSPYPSSPRKQSALRSSVQAYRFSDPFGISVFYLDPVDNKGIEPLTSVCKTDVFPLAPIAQNQRSCYESRVAWASQALALSMITDLLFVPLVGEKGFEPPTFRV
jgi:hypothetical protein